jgi:hypothetical protein
MPDFHYTCKKCKVVLENRKAVETHTDTYPSHSRYSVVIVDCPNGTACP